MTDIAIIGAGPYGLSLAAHLVDQGLNVRVFGQPMHTWRTGMPEGMVLKSEGFASNLWDPSGSFTLGDYCRERGLPYKDSGLPVPLDTFCDYGVAFQRRFVPMLDQRWVKQLTHDANGFALKLDDDEIVSAKRVVIAAGIREFHTMPPELNAIIGPRLSHSAEHRALEPFAGKNVLLIGGGASGVGMAALMSQRGAKATVAARKPRIAWCGPPEQRSLLERIKEPESGLGTGWRSMACVVAPMVFYNMPREFRHMVVRKHLGPAPGWTSRDEVERKVSVLLGAKITESVLTDDAARVTFMMNDGSKKTVEADHVVAATGYRIDMRRFSFIGQDLVQRLRTEDLSPKLSPYFETTVPGLFVIGTAASNSFGPLLRFAYGAGFASKRLSRYLRRSAPKRVVALPASLAPA